MLRDIIFLLLGAAIPAASYLFIKWVDHAFPKCREVIENDMKKC